MADRNAFPLHRSTWSFAQLWAYPTGIVVGSSIAIIGLLTVVGLARQTRDPLPSIAALLVTVILAPCVYLLGVRLGRLGPEGGVLVVHVDRIEIRDDQLLDGRLVLTRDDVAEVTQPGVRGSGPFGDLRAQVYVGRLVRGSAAPNVEIWLRGSVAVPGGPPETGRRVTMLQLLTPGAGMLLRWANPDERFQGASPKWYDRAGGDTVRWY